MQTDAAEDNEGITSTTGQILRRCREQKNISLDDASFDTKIGRNFLNALEEDRYDEFRSLTYLKGFLKTYAVYLGLDPEALLRNIEAVNAVKTDGKESATPSQKLERRRHIWQQLFLPTILLASIIVTSFFYSPADGPYVKTRSPIPPLQQKPVIQQHSSAVAQAKPQPDKADTEAAPPEASEQSPQPPIISDALLLRMKVLKNGAMTVALDETSPQSYELASGDVIEWKADRMISMELSDAGGVEISLNGKSMKLPGKPGKPVSVTIDSKGIRQ